MFLSLEIKQDSAHMFKGHTQKHLLQMFWNRIVEENISIRWTKSSW